MSLGEPTFRAAEVLQLCNRINLVNKLTHPFTQHEIIVHECEDVMLKIFSIFCTARFRGVCHNWKRIIDGAPHLLRNPWDKTLDMFMKLNDGLKIKVMISYNLNDDAIIGVMRL